MRLTLSLLVAALLVACAAQPPATTTEPAPRAPTAASPGINLAGYSPAFRAGYADGCGSVDAARKRDESRFKADTDYALGWRDGNDICKRRK